MTTVVVESRTYKEITQQSTRPQLSVDLGTHSTSFKHTATTTTTSSEEDENNNTLDNKKSSLNISIDPSSVVRLGYNILIATGFCFSAFLGTLRLLAPLVVSRQVLNAILRFFADYLRGRYL